MAPATATVSGVVHLNINEASKVCGLSPSVLRIWELRYGWPNPKRKANGYRSYSPHLVDDLKRMALLVQEGNPIRQLIVDGLPNWPRQEDEAPPKPRTLDQTRALPEPSGRSEQQLRDDLIRALETHRGGAVTELLQRAAWQLRQKDELDTALAPTVVGLSELAQVGRPLPAQATAPIAQAVISRCRQVHRIIDPDSATLQVLPLTRDDLALAWVVAVALGRQQQSAVVVEAATLNPDHPFVVATNGVLGGSLISRCCAVIGGLASDDRHGLHAILGPTAPLPWATASAT